MPRSSTLGRASRAKRLALGATVMALAGAGVMTTGSSSAATSLPAMPIGGSVSANRAFAQADAKSLLGTLALPAGASASAGEPPGDGSALALAAQRPASEDLIDDTGWWQLAGTQQAAIAYVESHPPGGSKLVGTGSGNDGLGGTAVDSASFAWPGVRNVLGSRMLVVAAARLADGQTGLRADAQVVWTVPRAAAERIPAGAVSLRITVVGRLSAGRPRQRSIVLSSKGRIRAIVALINALPLTQPSALSCPADLGGLVRLSFYAVNHAAPVAVAVVRTSGCREVQLTLAGARQATLDGAGSPHLISRIETALDLS